MDRETRKNLIVAKRDLKKKIGVSIENMSNGSTMLKYGRFGKPKPRHIYLDDRFLCWRDPVDLKAPVFPKIKKINGVVVKIIPGKRCIELREVKSIKEGRTTKGFKGYSGNETFSFSVITTERSLDLEASSEIEKRIFLQQLHLLLAMIGALQAAQQEVDEVIAPKKEELEQNPIAQTSPPPGGLSQIAPTDTNLI